MQHHLLLAIIFVTSIACSNSSGLSKRDSKRIEAEVHDMLQAYHKEVESHGLSAEFKFLDSSKQFLWHPAGYQTPISYDSVATILRQMDDFYTSIQSHWDTLTITPVSDTTAQYTGEFTSKMTDVTGFAETYRMHETGTLIRRHDGWKMLSGKTYMLPSRK